LLVLPSLATGGMHGLPIFAPDPAGHRSMVAQRTREIGIRMALGSSIGQVMVEIARSGVAASLFGVVLGLVLSAGALRVMRSVLYGVGVYDITTNLLVVLTLLVITLLATLLPTLRIARIDPARTLREE
jgi:ABC-type antimicrobial peptide transport system permease subunit